VLTDGNTSNFRHAWYDGSAYFNVTAASGAITFSRVGGGGNVTTDESFRAPIFYDSANTAYYVDPASTSNLVGLTVANTISGTISSVSATTALGIRNSFSTTINTTTPGTTNYGISFDGHGTSDYAAGITWAWSGTSAQAGIYVQSSGSYGTKMYIATTDSFATGSKTSMSIDHLGVIQVPRSYLQSDSSLRAPIFYDSNNTAYYLDPNSITSLRTVGSWRADSSTWDGEFPGKMQYHSNNWYLQYAGSMLFRNPSGANVMDCNTSGDLTVSSSSRAPIFYDSNNTAYYLDPASTSTLNQVNLQGYLRRNVSNSGYLEGNYSSASTGDTANCIYTIGGAYQPSTTNLGNMYGCGYTVGNGTSNPGLGQTGWGLYVASGGTSRIFLDSDSGVGQATGSWRAPIFYDRDNTAYYVNPNSDSRLSSVYANDYFRAQGSTGLYLQDYAYYFDRNPDVYGNWRCGVNPQNSYVGISYAYSSSRVTTMFDSSGNGGLFNYTYWIYYWLVGNACLGVRTSTTSASYAMYVEGGIYSTGNVVAYSDVRKKRNIVTVDNALDTVNKLRGVFYNRIETNDEKVDPNKRQIGVIAQEVNEVLPEAVTYAKDVDEYGVQYGNMAGLFIEAIKELTAKIDALEQRIAA
jgi:hypothetical protein